MEPNTESDVDAQFPEVGGIVQVDPLEILGVVRGALDQSDGALVVDSDLGLSGDHVYIVIRKMEGNNDFDGERKGFRHTKRATKLPRMNRTNDTFSESPSHPNRTNKRITLNDSSNG